jgi:hypothetical protein
MPQLLLSVKILTGHHTSRELLSYERVRHILQPLRSSLSHGAAPNHTVLMLVTVILQFELSRTGRTQPKRLLCQAVVLPIRTHVKFALVQSLEFLFTLRVCTFGDTCILHSVLPDYHGHIGLSVRKECDILANLQPPHKIGNRKPRRDPA